MQSVKLVWATPEIDKHLAYIARVSNPENQENENIVAEALSDRPECVVLNVPWTGEHVRRGRPWGTYIWPVSPWLDGFYVSIIMKKAEA